MTHFRARCSATQSRLVFLLATLVWGGPVGAQGVVFTRSDYAVGSSPQWLDLGDVDGDTFLDAVVATSASVSVLLGDGQGAFLGPYVAASGAFDKVLLDDLNQDGALDLVGLRASGLPGMSVALGNGQGGFSLASIVPYDPCSMYGTYLSDLVSGDLNNDQNPDLIALEYTCGGGMSFLGDGQGAFALTAGTGSAPYATSVGLADLNGDGILDFSTTAQFYQWWGNLVVTFGDGFGGYQSSAAQYLVPIGHLTSVTSTDVNGDAHMDLVVGGDGGLATLVNSGSGSLSVSTIPFANGGHTSVAAADFNQDGYPDIATNEFLADRVSVLLGNGQGSFATPTPFPVAQNPKCIAIGDLDHDGKPDIVSSGPNGSATISVLLNQIAVAGHVVFEDGLTPVASAALPVRVEMYTHPGHQLAATTSVSPEDGSYSVPEGVLAPGEYDLVAIATIPGLDGQFWFSSLGYSGEVCQPYDGSPSADITVSASGAPSSSILDFRLHWPAILIHGYLPGCFFGVGFCDGAAHYQALQPYLANGIQDALSAPRDAVMPVVPELRGKTVSQHFASLRNQLPRILSKFHPATRFQLVGYSQGGLNARRILYNPLLAGRVERVLQIGTPNDGTCVAATHCLSSCSAVPCGPSVCPLTPGSVAAFNQSYGSGGAVPFYLIAGSLFLPHPVLDNSCLAGLSNGSDGFVSVDSVDHLRTLNYIVIGATEVYPARHEDLPSYPGVMDQVRAWLTQ